MAELGYARGGSWKKITDGQEMDHCVERQSGGRSFRGHLDRGRRILKEALIP